MSRRDVTAVSAVGVAIALGYVMGRARASGIPTSPPVMTYSGTLTDSAGTPLKEAKNIQIQFWDRQSGGSTPVCLTPSSSQPLVAGTFQVPLPDPCVAAVHANAELWAEVIVDGASLGRTKQAAVPYAIEADTASHAAGALEARLAAVEKSVTQLQGGVGALVQTGVVSASTERADWNLSAGPTGSREYTIRVPFPKPFAKVPVVSVAINHIDSSAAVNERVHVTADGVDVNGFTVHLGTWADSLVYGLGVSWVAFVQ